MEEIIQKAYIAYYGRPADPAGLKYWTGRLQENGGDLSAIMEEFGNSQEFESRFGEFDDESLVNNLFQQIIGRDADPDGLNFYTEQI